MAVEKLELKKILVPVDFSDRSLAAAHHAAAMARRFGSELVFLHVVPPGPYEHGIFGIGYTASSVWPSQEEIEERIGVQLQELVHKAAGGLSTDAEVSWGAPAAKIEEMANHEQVDLIMMPSHGFGPFRRFILGSVTTKVLHDLSCPVFTGAHVADVPSNDSAPYHRVACAIDLSPHSEAVLRWAAGFALAWGAALHVIHAAPALDAIPPEIHPLPANFHDTVVRLKIDQVNELVSRVGCEATVHVECDSVIGYVTDVSQRAKVDLLVIGRSLDESLIGRLRTYSSALIREAPCAVVSI